MGYAGLSLGLVTSHTSLVLTPWTTRDQITIVTIPMDQVWYFCTEDPNHYKQVGFHPVGLGDRRGDFEKSVMKSADINDGLISSVLPRIAHFGGEMGHVRYFGLACRLFQLLYFK